MNVIKSLIIIVSLFSSPLVTGAEKDIQINTILEETGFNKLLHHIPDFAQAVLKQSSGALDPETGSALSRVFSRSFASEPVKHDVIQVINAHFDAAQADAYVRHLESPLYNKMAGLERSTSDPANRADIQSFIKQLETTPASSSRAALVNRLDLATRTTDFSVDMQTAFFRAIFIAIEPVMESDMRLGEGELEKMVDEVRNSLSESLSSNTRLTYYYAFRDVSDTELQQYVELCESDEYRWAIQLLGNAMISALNQAADRAAIMMAQNND